MQINDPTKVVDLGGKMYLFQHKAGVYADKLIISSHSGISKDLPKFTPGAVTLAALPRPPR